MLSESIRFNGEALQVRNSLDGPWIDVAVVTVDPLPPGPDPNPEILGLPVRAIPSVSKSDAMRLEDYFGVTIVKHLLNQTYAQIEDRMSKTDADGIQEYLKANGYSLL